MTVLGLIIGFVGLIALAGPRRWIYALFLFSIPFSGTSVVNIGSGATASGVQVWMYFGALLLLRDLVRTLLDPDTGFSIKIAKRALPLGIFVLGLTASLVMPFYIDGHLDIESPILTDFSTSPLYFSSKNITALLYIVFGSLLALSIARKNVTLEQVRFTERTYLAAAMFACSLGATEFLAHLLHLQSPTMIFRNSASPGAAGNLALLEGGIARVSSVATEPSILAQYLCTAIPLAVPGLLGRGCVFSRRTDRFAFFLMFLIFLLTTSSVAYSILVLAPILCVPIFSRMGIKATKAALYTVFGFAVFGSCVAALYLLASPVREVMDAALFAKSESYSSLERLKTVVLAWGYFKDYPILGVGWGSVTSHDLVAMILANAGVMGLLTFASMLILLARPVIRLMKRKPDSITVSRAMWLLSGLLLVTSSILAGFPFVFGYFWIVIAMGMAAGTKEYRGADATPQHSLVPSEGAAL